MSAWTSSGCKVREACLAAEERYGLESTAPGDRTAPRRPSRAETREGRPPRPGRAPARHAAPAGHHRRRRARAASRSSSPASAAPGCWSASGSARRNPGQVTGYAVALPGDTAKDGGPVWYGGGKLAADLTWPKLRQRWAGPGAAPGDPFTAAERNAIWEHAARAAEDAAAQIRLLAGTDPAAAADAAWAASDTLHVAAAALGSRILRQAADAYDRAARAPYARIPVPHPGREPAAPRRPAHLRVRLPHQRPGARPRSCCSPGWPRSPRRSPGCARPSSTPPRPPARCTPPSGCTPPQAPPPRHAARQRSPVRTARRRWQAHHSRNHPGHCRRTPPHPARAGPRRAGSRAVPAPAPSR